MSVKLLDNKAFYGYRVRRTVAGRLYQEYFSLKRDGQRLDGREREAVAERARERDLELERMQARERERQREQRCFHQDGSVRGISFLLKTEKSGSMTPIFQVGIASELEQRTVCTSFSLNAHGSEGAWRRAVEAYARHKQIKRNSRLYRRLVEAMPDLSAEVVPARRRA